MKGRSTETMRALVKWGSGREALGMADVPVPKAGAGHARVAVEATGICGTDLHIMDDEYPSTPPVVLGHEVCGVVDLVGESVGSDWLGARVALETYASTCGVCAYCRDGHRNLCPERRSIGSHANGGFAPFVVVPALNLHRVSDSVSASAGAIYEPLACVAHCLCDPPVASPGDSAMVVGPGTIGLLTAQVLRAEGAMVTVVGIERDGFRLEVARSLGLAAERSEAFAALVPGGGFDVVADCSGAEKGIELALQAVRKGGRVVQLGIVGRPIMVDWDLICLKELQVSSGFASTPSSWARAERMVANGSVQLEPLISGNLPLSAWREAFDRTRRGDCVKLVLDPRSEA